MDTRAIDDDLLNTIKPKQKVILLNGPPGSGKDTLANELSSLVGLRTMRFKDKLFDITEFISGISYRDWFKRYDNRDLKEEPWDELGGLSQREFLIRVSEDWVKPVFGKDYFGKCALRTVKVGKQDVVFSDSGFVEEAQVLVDDPELDVYVIHLHRDGCSFAGDSRGYVHGLENTIEFKVTEGDAREDALRILKKVYKDV